MRTATGPTGIAIPNPAIAPAMNDWDMDVASGSAPRDREDMQDALVGHEGVVG